MPSISRFKRGAMTLRDFAIRVSRRIDRYPRLPFAAILAMALVVLAVAIDRPSLVDSRVVEVPEMAETADEVDGWTWVEGEAAEAEYELLEWGASKVTVDGKARIIVAVVLRNPYDRGMYSGSLTIAHTREDGTDSVLEDLYLGGIPANSTMQIGQVLISGVEGVDVETLRVELESSMLEPERESLSEAELEDYFPVPDLPEVRITGMEPLLSPDGYRVEYEITYTEDHIGMDALSVVFRDEEGRLLGGMPVALDPFSDLLFWGASRSYPEGTSVQSLDLPASWIPEGADLDRIEIGSSLSPGG
ncbi:hypothetical protein AB0B28_21690 [Glycomyces sp. NPDC046736]|uniref:hypothetical protein n=1 Tax=Glycomyces sp. NPDC046736 TaxID=3155615 RepID=UPI0033D5F4A4